MHLNLYQMTYRKMMAETGYIEASSLQKAEELGREWCAKQPGCRFINVRDAVLCREQVPVEQPQYQQRQKTA